VYLRRLLSVKFNICEETSPPDDLPCRYQQRQQLGFRTRRRDYFLLTSALVDSVVVQLKEEAVGASSRDRVVGVRGIACAFKDLSVVFSREFDSIVARTAEILQRSICGSEMLCRKISEKRGQF
jgi:hypothetical protein